MKKPVNRKSKEWLSKHFKIPPGIKAALCVLPAVSTALFFVLRPVRSAMDWVAFYISIPIRRILAMLSSIYPVSLMEILCTAAGIFLIYYVIKAIRDSSRKRQKWKLLGNRILVLLVVSCYIYSLFCWLWSSGYHTTGFAERSGFENAGVSTGDLAAVTRMFADKAGEASVLLERDEEGNLLLNRSEMFADSRRVYSNISSQFPALSGTVYAPKPMYLYSWLMTITGYTGIYFALTGEAMVNTQLHAAYMPATVAHEHAHQLGVFAEDEATFAGILACVTSENPVFEYAGYLTGLGYLSNALFIADYEEYADIMSSLPFEVRLDRYQNSEFWANARTADMGIGFLDRFFTSLMETSHEVVDSVYDDYLKRHSQDLGIQSYGACIDLLVEYFIRNAGEET